MSGAFVALATENAQSSLRLYDCDAEFSIWRQAWTLEWKKWCCENEGKGCPSTSTQTTSTKTLTTTTATRTTTMSDPRACDRPCAVDGVEATCKERIFWSSRHETQQKANPCEDARKLVQAQCSFCGWCTAEVSQCGVAEDSTQTMRFRRKYDVNFFGAFSNPVEVSKSWSSFLSFAAGAVSMIVLIAVGRKSFGAANRWRRVPRSEEPVLLDRAQID